MEMEYMIKIEDEGLKLSNPENKNNIRSKVQELETICQQLGYTLDKNFGACGLNFMNPSLGVYSCKIYTPDNKEKVSQNLSSLNGYAGIYIARSRSE